MHRLMIFAIFSSYIYRELLKRKEMMINTQANLVKTCFCKLSNTIIGHRFNFIQKSTISWEEISNIKIK